MYDLIFCNNHTAMHHLQFCKAENESKVLQATYFIVQVGNHCTSISILTTVLSKECFTLKNKLKL